MGISAWITTSLSLIHVAVRTIPELPAAPPRAISARRSLDDTRRTHRAHEQPFLCRRRAVTSRNNGSPTENAQHRHSLDITMANTHSSRPRENSLHVNRRLGPSQARRCLHHQNRGREARTPNSQLLHVPRFAFAMQPHAHTPCQRHCKHGRTANVDSCQLCCKTSRNGRRRKENIEVTSI